MSAIVWKEVTEMATELDGKLGVLAQNGILAIVNGYLNVAGWGGETSALLHQARIYLAAHYATLQIRRGVSGSIQSQSMGGVSQAYASPIQSTSFLSTTSYGQLYLTLARTRGFRAGTTLRNPTGNFDTGNEQ